MPTTDARFPRSRIAGAALSIVLAVAACADAGATAADRASGGTDTPNEPELFDSSIVHEITITFDEQDYDDMVATFADSGTKEWIEAQVTIDGTTYERVGIRLKGNSSLMGLRGGDTGRGGAGGNASSDEPEQLPWLIRLDRFVDGQDHQGISDLVVRSNTSETSLNEAVAVELLAMAGLASQDAIAVRFSVNDSTETLRLVIEHPDDTWMAEEFSADGALYKAESTGDYTYRGDDPDAYDEVFDQEAGEANADLTPLIEFLAFINQSDDATFAAELADHLDVESFATYLAMQELVANFDDIDGPGNNSYLYYEPDTGRFTVVPWDHNLAFGGFGGGGLPGGAGRFGGDAAGGGLPFDVGAFPQAPTGEGFDGELPGGFEGQPPGPGFDGEPPEGFEGQPPGPGFDLGGAPGGRGESNVLSERFLAVEEFAALYEAQLAELRADLYDSGAAADVLAVWVDVLTGRAADLVDPDTVADEAAAITAIIDAGL
jgi:spore coat protein CotH